MMIATKGATSLTGWSLLSAPHRNPLARTPGRAESKGPKARPLRGRGPALGVPLLRSGLLHEEGGDRPGGLAQVGVLLVVLRDPFEDLDRVALRRAVLQTHDREPPDGGVRISRRELVQQWSKRIHVAGMGPRQAFECNESRSARGRAVVLQAATQQLELLTEPELRDRAICLRTDAVVGVASACLDLLVPLRAEGRESPFVACLCEGVRLGSRLGERH